MDVTKIIEFISPLIIGLVSAYFGSLIALQKYKKEKVWDEQKNVYKAIIDSFEEIIHWAEFIRASHYGEPIIDSKSNHHESLRMISKYSISGGFTLSSDFHKILKTANSELIKIRFEVNEESRQDASNINNGEWGLIYANEVRSVVEKFIPQLVECAKAELPLYHIKKRTVKDEFIKMLNYILAIYKHASR